MTKALKLIAIAAVMTITAASASYGQVKFCIFFDDNDTNATITTYNSQPVPEGSIIKAFDPQGVLCGQDTVKFGQDGRYGFLPVIEDDPSTPGIDEGAEPDDTIDFTINGRPATVVAGDPTWAEDAFREVSLSASSTTIAITGVKYPRDSVVGFNYTVRFRVGVRNDGDGMDYYGVTATSHKGWTITAQPDFVYADPTDTAFIYFDVDIPLWFPGGDTTDTVDYSVFSLLDPTQTVDSSLQIFSSITVGIDDDIDDILPSGFVLEQNYPNPFNPTTNIAFEIPVRSTVRLEFYDILGREVQVAELGSLSSGQHIFEFDGSGLSSGVYFYRMVAENFVQSRKMLLVK